MSTNKTIAKNTLFLYFRMVLVLVVSLYTSRIILNTLGVEDFGIYNLVAGFVTLLTILNNVMTATTQRFFNFEIGKKESGEVNKVFSISINIHLVIAALILILGETIGLWFLNNKLNIPSERMYAANIVYQISLLTTVINLLRIPYNSIVIAYEKMSFYAILGIIEVIGKLLIVLVLVYFIYDKLIAYAILLAGLTILINLFYFLYCKKNYSQQTNYKYVRDQKLVKEMTSFSGWSMVGNIALTGSNQGLSIILNMFFGVAVNATMGIANQVNTAMYSFVSNFQMAFMPQITQSYAENDLNKHRNMLLQASKFSFFLLLIISVPVLVNTEYILTLWLKEFPPYSVQFTQLIIIFSLIDAMAGPFWMSANAIGNIKKYQLGIAFLLMLNLPLSYLLLHLAYPPTIVFTIKIILNLLIFLYRFIYVNIRIKFPNKDILRFVKEIVLTLIITILMSYSFYYYNLIENGFLNLILETLLVIVLTFGIVLIVGIKKEERMFLKNFILKKIN